MNTINNMQDITRDKERERIAIANTRVCFEVRAHLLYIPAFDTRRISTMQDPQRISPRCLNTYKPSDSQVPYTPQAHRLVEAAPRTTSSHPNSTTNNEHTCPFPQRTRKNLFDDHNTWSPKEYSHYNTPIGISSNGKLKCGVRKARKDYGENLKESLKTLSW